MNIGGGWFQLEVQKALKIHRSQRSQEIDTLHFLSDSISSTRIKDAGVAIRHSQGGILFYTAGSRNGLEGVGGNGIHTQNQVDPKKMMFFVIEKYVLRMSNRRKKTFRICWNR